MHRIWLFPVILILALALPAAAHHGWGNYNSAQTVEVSGTVARIDWGNPHVVVWLAVGGNTAEVVLAPPSRMTRRGLDRDMIQPGTAVSVDAYQHRSVPSEYRAERIRVAGKSVELR